MPVSKAKVLCFSAGLLVLYLILLPVHAKLKQCKSEQVEVDLEGHLTVHYSLCDDPGSVCFQQHNESCDPEKEFEEITEAKLIDLNGNSHTLKVRDDKKGFHVLLPEEGESTGVFHYNITYKYEAECIYPLNSDCTGWVRDLRLSVTVVDYKLRLSSSNDVDILEISATDEVQIQSGRNVSLLCLSGLTDDFSSLNIPVTFLFSSKHDTDEHNVSATCDGDNTVSVNNGKWIITRQQSPPHDCVLTIVDFGGHDVGKYCCAGVLSQSDSPSLQVEDWSNHLHLKLLTSVSNLSSLAVLLAIVFFGIIITAIIAIFLAFTAIIIVTRVYEQYKKSRRQPDQVQVLPRFQCYGSTSTIHNDLSRSHTPNPNGTAETQPLITYFSEDDTTIFEESEAESDMQSSSGIHREIAVSAEEVHAKPPPQESSSFESQKSVIQVGVNAYMEHMHIQPAEGDTPKDSLAPPNPNYRCPICHKTYKDDQRLFWKRHWSERDKRCIPCSQKQPKDSSAPDTTANGGASQLGPPSIPHISSNLSLPGVFHSSQPTGPQNEANGPQFETLIVSGTSTMSIGEQGVKFYDQQMGLQPAIGDTPTDSTAPLNPNYRCPNCKKTYHDDQRTFYARHWNERERRCVACTKDQPNATVACDDTSIPLSGANTLTGDLSTQPTMHDCVTPPTLVNQTLPTAAAAGSEIDKKDMDFMSESDRSTPPSSQSTSDFDS